MILIGGTSVPSWKISVFAGPMLPGRDPPRSQKCAKEWQYATTSPWKNTGAMNTMSGVWVMLPWDRYGSLYQYRSPGFIWSTG